MPDQYLTKLPYPTLPQNKTQSKTILVSRELLENAVCFLSQVLRSQKTYTHENLAPFCLKFDETKPYKTKINNGTLVQTGRLGLWVAVNGSRGGKKQQRSANTLVHTGRCGKETKSCENQPGQGRESEDPALVGTSLRTNAGQDQRVTEPRPLGR